MNCEGVRAVIENGYFATTTAERNAACVHCRTCQDCQAMILEGVKAIPVKEARIRAIAAAVALAVDRADPEWK